MDSRNTPSLPAVQYRPTDGRRGIVLPVTIVNAGDRASRRFLEFFAANIRNPNTRAAYAKAVARFFQWCENNRPSLKDIEADRGEFASDEGVERMFRAGTP